MAPLNIHLPAQSVALHEHAKLLMVQNLSLSGLLQYCYLSFAFPNAGFKKKMHHILPTKIMPLQTVKTNEFAAAFLFQPWQEQRTNTWISLALSDCFPP